MDPETVKSTNFIQINESDGNIDFREKRGVRNHRCLWFLSEIQVHVNGIVIIVLRTDTPVADPREDCRWLAPPPFYWKIANNVLSLVSF